MRNNIIMDPMMDTPPPRPTVPPLRLPDYSDDPALQYKWVIFQTFAYLFKEESKAREPGRRADFVAQERAKNLADVKNELLRFWLLSEGADLGEVPDETGT